MMRWREMDRHISATVRAWGGRGGPRPRLTRSFPRPRSGATRPMDIRNAGPGDGEPGDLRDGIVRLEDGFDFRRRDVFSGAPDDVLLPVDEGEHAVRVTPHDVARVEPAAAPRLFRRLGVLEVAGKEAMPWPLG